MYDKMLAKLLKNLERFFLMENKCTVPFKKIHFPSKEKRRFLYFNHIPKEFLELMMFHLKALI